MSRRRRIPLLLLALMLGLAALPALAAGPRPQERGPGMVAAIAPGLSWGFVPESLFRRPFQAVAKALHLSGAASTTPSPPPPATDGGSELNPDGKG